MHHIAEQLICVFIMLAFNWSFLVFFLAWIVPVQIEVGGKHSTCLVYTVPYRPRQETNGTRGILLPCQCSRRQQWKNWLSLKNHWSHWKLKTTLLIRPPSKDSDHWLPLQLQGHQKHLSGITKMTLRNSEINLLPTVYPRDIKEDTILALLPWQKMNREVTSAAAQPCLVWSVWWASWAWITCFFETFKRVCVRETWHSTSPVSTRLCMTVCLGNISQSMSFPHWCLNTWRPSKQGLL